MAYKKVKLNHISLKALEDSYTYCYNIYYKNNDNIFKVLIAKDTSFNNEIKKTIHSLKIHDVYVLTKDHKQYEQDTQNYLSKLIYNNNIPNKLKSEIIHEMAADTINELFQGEVNTDKIERSSKLVNDTINMILNDKSTIRAMLGVTSYDYYTYTHCVNVFIYAVGFAAYLDLKQKDIHTIGMAAILHDLGKKDIPNEIVNKNGKLTDDEFEIMKNHPSLGVKILKSLGETNKLLFDLIEQHHEKLDGSGYPYGLKSDEIHLFSQILSISDIFDALTTKRSYKDALNSYRALTIMSSQMSNELNSKLFNKFITFMNEKI